MFKKLCILALGTSSLLTACVGNNTTGGNTPVVQSQVSVIIDPMSIVPVLNGTGTQGTLYIHNYTNQAVSGLDFNLNQATFTSQVKNLIAKAGLNLGGGIEDKNGFVLLNSERCIQIAANSSCAINFMTPNLSFGNQGSALVNVTYTSNDKPVTNSQVVNYSYLDSSLATGVNFTGNVDLSGTPGTTKYVVGYLYGGASNGGVYKNVNLVSDNPTLAISGGFINGQEVASNQVMAVEYKIAIQSNQKSYVEVIPTWGYTTSSISRSNVVSGSGSVFGVSIDPIQNTANYVFGNVPILKAETAYQASIPVVNNGNADGTAITATKTGGNTEGITINTNACTADKLLANANGSCQITYTVNTYTPGSTVVDYKNSSGTVVGSQVIYWTNDKPAPAVSSIPTPRNVEMAKESNSQSIQFNFENIGNAPLESMIITPVVIGPVEWKVTESNCTTSTMGINGSCYIKGYIKPSNDGVGVVYYTITGKYESNTYNFLSLPVRYTAVAAPKVVITPAQLVNVTVLANDESSVSSTYIVKNIGNDHALFTSLGLSAMTNSHKPVIANGGTCSFDTVLTENESCTVVVNYGPEASSIVINESGSTNILINYHGGTPDTSYTTMSESYNYSLVSNDTYAQESIIVSGFESGTGTGDNPYKATALNESGQIKVTYTNPSVNYAMESFNLNTNNLPYGMKVVTSTCPTESSIASLGKGASCEIIFGLDKEVLKTSPQGGSTVFNFTTPTVTWTTPLGFYEQVGTNINISYLQPTVNFSLSRNSNHFESTVLTASIVNGNSGTSPFIVDVSAVKRWLENKPVALTNNCTVNPDYSANCSLNSSGAESLGKISYVMPTHLQENESAMIPLFYSSVNNGYLSPVYSFINFMNIAFWQNVGNAGFSAGAVDYTSLAIDESSTPYVAYQDGGNSKKLTVMKFNGVSWIAVGNAGFSKGEASFISLAFNPSTNQPYVAYVDDGYGSKAMLMKYNGATWESVGAEAVSSGIAGYTQLAFNPSNDEPYVAYKNIASIGNAIVKRYNGSWISVGNPLPNSSNNVNFLSLAFNPSNSIPYLAYMDGSANYEASVMYYSGAAGWSNVGSAGFSNDGSVYGISLAFNPSTNQPYVAYKNQDTTKKATVMQYDGAAWTVVGESSFSAGSADYTSLAFESSTPYVAYKDGGNANKATVMKYNGSSWIVVGSAGFSQGGVDYTSLAFGESGIPYVAFKDGANSGKATVMQYKY